MELSAKLTHVFCWEEIFSGETPSSSNQASHITCDGVSATHRQSVRQRNPLRPVPGHGFEGRSSKSELRPKVDVRGGNGGWWNPKLRCPVWPVSPGYADCPRWDWPDTCGGLGRPVYDPAVAFQYERAISNARGSGSLPDAKPRRCAAERLPTPAVTWTSSAAIVPRGTGQHSGA